MLNAVPARREARPNGVIDTLTAGYAVVNRLLWLLLLPIAVDLFLWLGPQVSFSPLVDPILLQASQVVRQVDSPRRAPRLRTQVDNAPPTLSSQADELRQTLTSRTSELNALALIAHGPLSVPSAAPVLAAGRGTFQFVRGWGEALLVILTTLAGGLLLGSFFRGVLAARLRGNAPLAAVRDVLPDIARVLGFLAAVLGVALLLGVPLLLLVSALALITPAIATIGLIGVFVVALFVQVHLFFAVDAIFVSRIGPLAAVQRSVSVVRRFPGATLGLILLTWLIVAGMDRVWEVLAASVAAPYGTLASIVGNAYITSGLIAASMIFYRERAAAAAEQLQPAPSVQGA